MADRAGPRHGHRGLRCPGLHQDSQPVARAGRSEPDVADAFRGELAQSGIARIVAHDSYLINLASPDRALRARSEASFRAELARCERLGIPYVVSHPGNFIDDRAAGLARNAEAYTRCLERCRGRSACCSRPRPAPAPRWAARSRSWRRCATPSARWCATPGRLLRRHLPSLLGRLRPDAGLRRGVAAVGRRDRPGEPPGPPPQRLEDAVPLPARPARAHRRRLARARAVPADHARPAVRRRAKILETPKGDDEFTQDRRMLRRLRAYARVRPAR